MPLRTHQGEETLGFDRAVGGGEKAIGEGIHALVEYGSNVAMFCWAGDRVLDTLLVQLRDRDLPVECDGIAVVVNDISASALIHLRTLAAQGPADAVQLAGTVKNKLNEKHHVFLNEELLSVVYASSRLDPEGAWQAVVRVVGQVASP